MTKYMIDRPLEKVGEIHCDWERLIDTLTYDTLDTKPEKGDSWHGRFRHYGTDLTGFARRFGDAIAAAVGGTNNWRWCLNRTQPPVFTKPHKDQFKVHAELIGEKFESPEASRNRYLRFWIPMRDRQPGQFFECDGVPPVFDWKAGDIYISPSAHFHYGATVGHEDRYTFLMDGYNDDPHIAAKGVYQILHVNEKEYE